MCADTDHHIYLKQQDYQKRMWERTIFPFQVFFGLLHIKSLQTQDVKNAIQSLFFFFFGQNYCHSVGCLNIKGAKLKEE